ncbi:MAG TPA: hypothetical protein V6C58_25840 [Allocoleopsis sp.]
MQKSFILGLSLVIGSVLTSNTMIKAQNLPDPPNVPSERVYQAPTNLYRIYVNGNSTDLLKLVRSVDPEAFIRPDQNVIQVGLYSDFNNAQSRVLELEKKGIPAQMNQIGDGNSSDTNQNNTTNPLPTNTPVPVPNNPPPANTIVSVQAGPKTGGYFVVIPGVKQDLAYIAEKVISAGLPRDIVYMRDAPRGTHVAVGPFENRALAERWSSYFRSLSMDARVYFGR